LVAESTGLYLSNNSMAEVGCGGNYSRLFNQNKDFDFNVTDNSTIQVRVDMNDKTAFYYINNNQFPVIVYNISSSPLLFGISGIETEAVVEITSVQKILKRIAYSSVEYEEMEWVNKW
jgi:hypothetical protein